MKQIRFWNPLTNKFGTIYIEKIICTGCKKEIKRRFITLSHSFDFYHPSCLKRRKKSIVIIVDDLGVGDARNLKEKE